MADSGLTGLALLQNQLESGSDYIDYFVPLIAEGVRLAGTTDVTVEMAQESTLRTFGLDVPIAALNTILGRCRKRGYLSRLADGSYEYLASQGRPDFSKVEASVSRDVRSLVDAYIKFCAERGSQIQNTAAESQLLDYIGYQSDPLIAAVYGRKSGKPAIGSRSDYLSAAFLRHILENDSQLANCAEAVIKGSMLAQALYFPRLSDVPKRFKSTTIYLDTPLLLSWLGTDGPQQRRPVHELVTLSQKLGAHIGCFDRTILEAKGVLEFIASSLESPNPSVARSTSPGLVYAMRSRRTASEIRRIIYSLDNTLADAGFALVDDMPCATDDPQMQAIRDSLSGDRYQRDSAREHDIRVAQNTLLLREHRNATDIEGCAALLVTSNVRFSHTVNSALESFSGNGARCIPCCLTETALTTIVWIKNPDFAPHLPKAALLASCYAAMNPTDEIWGSFLNHLDRLRSEGNVTASEYELLVYGSTTRQMIMEATYGDIERLTESSVSSIVLHAVSVVRQQEHESYLAERDQRISLQNEIEDRDVARYRRREELAGRLSSISAWVVWVVLTILFIGITILVTPNPQSWLPRLIGVAFGIVTGVTGVSIKGVRLWTARALHVPLLKAIDRTMTSLGLDG